MPGIGAATRLSLQVGCVQAGDASEGSSAPTNSDKKGSIPQGPNKIIDTMKKLALSYSFFLILLLKQPVFFLYAH